MGKQGNGCQPGSQHPGNLAALLPALLCSLAMAKPQRGLDTGRGTCLYCCHFCSKSSDVNSDDTSLLPL